MSILNNAIVAIQIGAEDYQSADPRRHLSALRNVSAGVLLLFKERLRRLSPKDDEDLLVKRDLVPKRGPDGSVVFVSRGRKTVDVQQIRERFKNLNVVVDWGLFDSMNELRNDVEHYYSEASADAIRAVLAKSFVLIREFVTKELHEEPADLLGADCWRALLGVAEVFAREQEECSKSMNAIDWTYKTLAECIGFATCPECGSPLIRTDEVGKYQPSLELKCVSCSSSFEAAAVIESCLDEHLGAEAHFAVKDGGDPPYDRCPQCDADAFVFSEEVCLVCEEGMTYEKCEWCETSLSLEEQILEGLCSYCSYKRDKMAAE